MSDELDDQAPIELVVADPDQEHWDDGTADPNEINLLLKRVPNGCRGQVVFLPVSRRQSVVFETDQLQRPTDPVLPERSASVLIIGHGRVAISISDCESFIKSVREALRMAKAAISH